MFTSLIVPWPRRSLKISCSLSPSCENIWWIGRSAGDAKYYAALPPFVTSSMGLLDPPYFFGGVAGGAAVSAPGPSIPNRQCGSTFLLPDFGVKNTAKLFLHYFFVTSSETTTR